MSIFSHIKEKLSILDVVSEYVTLKKAGLYYKGCCPFHHEKTASFSVSPHKEIYYCFGCKSGGDVIAFISNIEHCSQTEAVHFLAERYQINLPENYQGTSATFDEKKKYFHICELLAQWCHDSLNKSPSVLRYLYQRGINKECITYFKLGYFPSGSFAIRNLTQFMGKHTILVDDLLAAHIVNQGKSQLYSAYEERIIFPIKDPLGHYCGFGGRIYKQHDTRPKYYNSKESEYFNKSTLLYGFDLAKQSMQKENALFLVEGYTDCIAMVQHGYKHTAAVLGTACTLDHLKQIARYVDYVYVTYDGDSAGTQAILRLAELCWHVELEVKIIALPQGEDPASLLAKKTDIDYLIRKAVSIFEFFITQIGAHFEKKSLKQRLESARKIIQLIKNIQDPLKQDILLQEAAQTMNLPYPALKNEIKGQHVQPQAHLQSKIQPVTPVEAPHNVERIPKLEKELFSAIINDVSLLNKRNERYIFTLLPQELSGILSKVYALHKTNPDLVFARIFDQLDEYEKPIISQALLESEGNDRKDFAYLLMQLQKKHWKTIVNEVKLQLEAAKKEHDAEREATILHEFSTLKRSMLEKYPKQKDVHD